MRRKCPEWFQEKLARVGGVNPYGEPKFKLVWGESETMRDGGYFLRDGYEGYRDVAAIGGARCWALMMWEPACMYGTARDWYRTHRDPISGLVTLGQYPHRGRYRLIRKFQHIEMQNGDFITTRMEPSNFVLDVMIPMIVEWNRFSEEKERDQMMEDSLASHAIRRDSPLVQKKAAEMERYMAQAMALAARTQPGLAQKGV